MEATAIGLRRPESNLSLTDGPSLRDSIPHQGPPLATKLKPLRLSPFLIAAVLFAQQPLNWTAAEDHQNMLDQLGIKTLRPGVSGKDDAPNHANYDESTANPFPVLPDALKLKNGKPVTTAKVWWQKAPPRNYRGF